MNTASILLPGLGEVKRMLDFARERLGEAAGQESDAEWREIISGLEAELEELATSAHGSADA